MTAERGLREMYRYRTLSIKCLPCARAIRAYPAEPILSPIAERHPVESG